MLKTISDNSFNDSLPGEGDFGYEIEVIKTSDNGHVVSALAPVLNVTVDDVVEIDEPLIDGEGGSIPELGAALSAIESISVETFEKVEDDIESEQSTTLDQTPEIDEQVAALTAI